MTQAEIDFDAGQRAKEAGMKAAARGVTPEFRKAFMVAATLAAHMRPEGFTSDDIVCRLDAEGVPMPSEGRALGPLMQEMVRRGIAEPTGDYRKSRNKNCHATPRAVYRRK